MKYIFVFIIGAALALLVACESEPKPSPTATLLNNDEVHQAVQQLAGAADQLNANVARFSSENWREVVPDVETSAANVSYAASQLEKALGYSK